MTFEKWTAASEEISIQINLWFVLFNDGWFLNYSVVFVCNLWQFKMPRAELEKFEQAESEEVQRQILERFAQDLPVTNRTVTGCEYKTPV